MIILLTSAFISLDGLSKNMSECYFFASLIDVWTSSFFSVD